MSDRFFERPVLNLPYEPPKWHTTVETLKQRFPGYAGTEGDGKPLVGGQA
jgi:hypothetical protein